MAATNPSTGMLQYFETLRQAEAHLNRITNLPICLQSYNLDDTVTNDATLYSAHAQVQDYDRAYNSIIDDAVRLNTFLTSVVKILHRNAHQADHAFRMEQQVVPRNSVDIFVRFTMRESAVAAHRVFCETWKPFREFLQELYQREAIISSALQDLTMEVARREGAFDCEIVQ